MQVFFVNLIHLMCISFDKTRCQMDPDGMKTSALEIAASFSRRQDMALLQAAAAAMEVGGYFW